MIEDIVVAIVLRSMPVRMDSVDSVEGDREVRAMAAVARALQGLEVEEIARVLSWARSRYAGGSSQPVDLVSPPKRQRDAAEIFELLAPRTDADRVLAIGYWFQVLAGEPDLDAARVNQECTNLGYPLSNVTTTFGRLAQQKPALAMQIRKAGSSRQARKRYRLTAEGIRRVEASLGGTHVD